MRVIPLALVAVFLTACARSGPQGASSTATKVGPPNGSLLVVGGGTNGPEIMRRFVELAGGNIIVVPTADGAPAYTQDLGIAVQFRALGATRVHVLHTADRAVANADTFVAHLKTAGGVWFVGGRHYRLVDSYAGTKAEAEFHNVLARGGVVAGTSAGASIQGSFLVRGAPSNNNGIMDYPGYQKGFAFLRGVGIDQHVVARERQPDIADSLMKKYPDLLFISEDEGTAWFVQGDIGEIVGRSKAFVYNGNDMTDEGKPFLTLWPGDRYNLATRRVTHRAISETNLTQAWVDSLLKAHVGSSQAQVLIAQGGKVFVNSSYNIPPQRRYMPTTTMPNFDLLGISRALNGAAVSWLVRQGRMSADESIEDGATVTVRQVLDGADAPDADRKLVALLAKKSGGAYAQLARQRVLGPAGTPKTQVDSTTGAFRSNVDEMYRLELAVFGAGAGDDSGPAAAPYGWSADRFANQTRLSAWARPGGKRAAFVRFPDRRATIILLTDNDALDAKAIVESLAEKLFGAR